MQSWVNWLTQEHLDVRQDFAGIIVLDDNADESDMYEIKDMSQLGRRWIVDAPLLECDIGRQVCRSRSLIKADV